MPALPDAAKQKIADWIAGGCPQGDAKDLPPPREFPEGWQIPQPDVVFKMPEPFEVPAKGTVEYQYFTIDPGLTEDKWIKAAECRPGNRAVTHHLILFFHPPGTKKFAPDEPLFNSIAGFAPGLPPSIYPEGVYRLVPAGSKLIIQAHYTPNGTPQTDQSEVGLVFADPAKARARDEGRRRPELPVPHSARANNHRLAATHKFEQDTLLYALTPHMHLRGKSFRFEAIYPDGSEEVLLDVPRYDFNWQNTYALAEPKRMPEGTAGPLHGALRQLGGEPGEPRSHEGRDLGRPDLAGDDGRHVQRGAGRAGPLARPAEDRSGRRCGVRSHVQLPAHRQGRERLSGRHVQRVEARRICGWMALTSRATTRRS